jgi:hypothetical protein
MFAGVLAAGCGGEPPSAPPAAAAPAVVTPVSTPAAPSAVAPAPVVVAEPDELPAPSSSSVQIGFFGRVVDDDGKPVAGAQLHLFAVDATDDGDAADARAAASRGVFAGPVATATSGADGAFAVPAGPNAAARRCTLVATRDGHADAVRAGLALAQAQTQVGDLTMARTAPMTGLVLGDGGRPLADATVACGELDQPWRLPQRPEGIVARTDGAGRFTLASVPASRVRLRVGAAGRATAIVDARGGASLRIELAPEVPLAGRVVDAGGQPIAGAYVTARAPGDGGPVVATARSGVDGGFALRGLGGGEWRVQAGRVGHAVPAPVAARAGGAPVECALARLGDLRLRVEVDGQTPPGFLFALRRAGVDAAPPSVRRVAADEVVDGVLALPAIEAGPWFVEAAVPGFAPALSTAFTVPSAAAIEVRVAIGRGATVRVRLVAADGTPVRGARVALQPDGHADRPGGAPASAFGGASGSTGADGALVLPRVGDGAFQARIERVEPPGWWCVRGLVVAGRDVDLGEVKLPQAQRLRGVVRGASAPGELRVLAAAQQGGALPEGSRLAADVAPDGAFELPLAVPPGRYRVAVVRRDAAERAAWPTDAPQVEVVVGAEAPLPITLPAPQ